MEKVFPRTPFQKLFWQGIGIVGVDVLGDPIVQSAVQTAECRVQSAECRP